MTCSDLEVPGGAPDIVHCFACFSQRKDPTNPRGYSQKSVVFLTKIKLYSFFKGLFADVAAAYFKSANDEVLREVYTVMNENWPMPEAVDDLQEVFLLGKKYEIRSEKENSYKHRFSAVSCLTHSPSKSDPGDREDQEHENLNHRKTSANLEGSRSISPEKPNIELPVAKGVKPGLCDDFKEINLYRLLGRQPACLIFKLWEIVMLNESLLVLADSPLVCR